MSGVGATHTGQKHDGLHRRETHFEETHNVSDVVLEPQVDHAIRLVHTQILAIRKPESLLLQHVDQSAGRGNDDVKSLVQHVALLPHGYATYTQEGVQRGVFGIFGDGSGP